MKKVKIFALDSTIEINARRVYIFAVKYKKRMKGNEIHNPGPCKIIVHAEDSITTFLFENLIIESNDSGKVRIWTNNTEKQIKGLEPLLIDEDLEKATQLNAIYAIKSKDGLSPDEVVEYNWAKTQVNLFKIINKKIPNRIGGVQ